MAYRYDLHCHTKEGSKCSDISVVQMVELYLEMGYAGICITDHFSGMTTVPDDTPWKERVLFHYDIYQKARAAGEKHGLSVFFGIEYSPVCDINKMTQGTGVEFVIFNLSKDWLVENKNAFTGTDREQLRHFRKAGGFVIHAHPFIYKQDTQCIWLYQNDIDAVEVINGGVSEINNHAALQYARAYGLLEAAGTDIHRFDHESMAGVETETRHSTLDGLINALKEGKAKPFSMKRNISDYWLEIQRNASEARKKAMSL